MSIKINVDKYSRSFEILDNNEVVLKANKPKWYSNRIKFFYTDKNYQTFEIKKKSFWSASYNIFKTGNLIGEIPYSWKKCTHVFVLHQSDKKYEIKEEKKGGTFSSDKSYQVLKNGEKAIFAIHASFKNWKLNIDVELIENNEVEYELIVYAYFLIKIKRQEKEMASSSFVATG